MNNPKISVVVPIYNLSGYINKCIESILSQTFEDFELILVNDGSKDDSLQICEDYSQKDERVIVLDQQNGGVVSARRTGVIKSRAPWVMFVDGDDLLFPDALLRMYEIACKKDVDIVVTAFCKNGKVENFSNEGVFDHDWYLEQTICYHLPMSTQNRLYKRSLFSDCSLVVDRKITNNEDFLSNLLLLKNVERVAVYNIPTYQVICRPGSASRIPYSQEYWMMYFKYEMELCKDNGIPYEICARNILNRLLNIIRVHKEYHFDLKDPFFTEIKRSIQPQRLKFREIIMYSLIGHSYSFIIKCLRFHPKKLLRIWM